MNFNESSSGTLMPEKLMMAIANPLFPRMDTQLRQGRHISAEDLELHSFIYEFYDELELYYRRYQSELISAPESFFYLRPKSTSDIATSPLSELDMLVGKVLCYLYLSPERLTNEGIFTLEELQEEIIGLTNEQQLMRMVNTRKQASDLDKQKLVERIGTSLRRLRRLGMLNLINGVERFIVNECVFRFAADVRGDEDPREVQLRMIRDGEAIMHNTNEPAAPAKTDVTQSDSQGIETIEGTA